MKKDEYIKRYGEEAYNEYKKKQAELSRQWRQKNKEKSRKYGREYYFRLKMLAMMGSTKDATKADDKDKNI